MLQQRTENLLTLGIKAFDALHLANAEQAGAKLFATVDDRLLAAAGRRLETDIARDCSAVTCLEELSK